MQYPADDEHLYHQVRSGSLWVWRIRSTAQIPTEKELSFPGLQQIVEIYRHKTHKRTGEISEETDLAVTNLSPTQADAATLAHISRRHWAIENNLHHKRDTVLAEDACRTRKAAQALRYPQKVCKNEKAVAYKTPSLGGHHHEEGNHIEGKSVNSGV
jgi:predicted transposase YbfD/YdcC